jgi:hypothetical protein
MDEVDPAMSVSERLTVRALYIVPSDRQPWPEIQVRMTEVLQNLQSFFADEMERHAYGNLTFNIARDSHGLLALQMIHTEFSSSQFPTDGRGIANYCKEIAAKRGLRSKKGGDTVIYFVDICHFDRETGACSGSLTRGSSSGRRRECFIGAGHFKMTRKEWLRSKEPYAGMMVPELHDEPLREGAFRDKNCGIPPDRPYTIGELSGKNYGAIAHELGHAFGLQHAFAQAQGDDRNRKGYLMLNGFRGMQGYFAPGVTDDFCHLSRLSAKYLIDNQLLTPVSKAT